MKKLSLNYALMENLTLHRIQTKISRNSLKITKIATILLFSVLECVLAKNSDFFPISCQSRSHFSFIIEKKNSYFSHKNLCFTISRHLKKWNHRSRDISSDQNHERIWNICLPQIIAARFSNKAILLHISRIFLIILKKKLSILFFLSISIKS